MKETQSGNYKEREKNLTGKKNDEAEVPEQKRTVTTLHFPDRTGEPQTSHGGERAAGKENDGVCRCPRKRKERKHGAETVLQQTHKNLTHLQSSRDPG